MDANDVVRWLTLAAGEMREHRDELTALDAAIGDADHGTNLDRGFSAVVEKLEASNAQNGDAGAVLTTAAKTLISTVGGASGVLYGTALLRMGATLAGKTTFGGDELVAALDAAAAGIAARGRSTVGEKTMLDAFVPAVAALRQAIERGASPDTAAEEAANAAEQGAEATIPLPATKGRAANLGPRSVGHKDPGAASTALLFRALATATKGTAADAAN
jgi:dihydroxyacetone kinase-like protein